LGTEIQKNLLLEKGLARLIRFQITTPPQHLKVWTR